MYVWYDMFNICIFHHIYICIICLSTQVIPTYWVVYAYISYVWYAYISYRVAKTHALSCRSFFAKEPLIIGLICGKWPIKIRHPMGLGHPVYVYTSYANMYVIRVCTQFTYITKCSTKIMYENYVHICICVHVFICVLKSITHVILGCGALLTDRRALLTDCKALLIAHHNVCVECKPRDI